MTIEEAIQHCKDEAAKLRKDSAKRLQIGLMHAANDCEECAAEHEQLAEWLEELKQRREAEITAPPKSNGDRIRQMTDEELAEMIVRGSICDMCNAYCDAFKTPEDCVQSVCTWLKQDVSLLDRLAAEYDRKHPNGLKLTDSPNEEIQQTEQEEKENERI